MGRSDPQIGAIPWPIAQHVHAHVKAAKTKLEPNSRAQFVVRASWPVSCDLILHDSGG